MCFVQYVLRDGRAFLQMSIVFFDEFLYNRKEKKKR